MSEWKITASPYGAALLWFGNIYLRLDTIEAIQPRSSLPDYPSCNVYLKDRETPFKVDMPVDRAINVITDYIRGQQEQERRAQ